MLLYKCQHVLEARHAACQRSPVALPVKPSRRANHLVVANQAIRRVTAPRTVMRAGAGAAAVASNSSSSSSSQNGHAATAEDPLTSVSPSGLPRSAVVGVLGGGQLGRMMALAAANMGVSVKFLDPAEGAAAAVAAEQTVGHFRDADAITSFAAGCDVLTVEIEHINADAMEVAGQASGVDVEPTPSTLRVIQDKHAQKKHFAASGVPVAPFADIDSAAALQAAADEFGFPLMLKSKRFAYDGRGNFVVKSADQLAEGVEALGGFGGVYAEKWATFVKELAVMVVRSRDGTVVSYPVVETIHKDNICHVTEAPANVPLDIQQRARAVAEQAVAALDGAGIFGVEMFLLPDGGIFLNEVAPRPHNSGHYTQNGCVSSQFENHVRAVLGWPLGDTSLNCGCCIMLNLLGEADGDEGVKLAHDKMAAAYHTPGASVHWYDKPGGMTKGRKIGHINIVAPTREEARQRLAAIEAAGEQALRRSDAAAQQAGIISAAAASAGSSSQSGAKGPAGLSSAGAGGSSSSGSSQQAGSRGVQAAAASGAGAGSSGKAPKVGIIMGSDSDLPTMKAAEDILQEFGVPCELTIVSAHRTPDRMMTYARTAHERGLQVIIAGAGGAAHLPGMVAAMTPLPVVGVPVKPAGAYLDGVDALLSIVQMPKGVPVATVAIGNAANAGLLAVRILAGTDKALLQKMLDYQEGMKDMVLQKAAKVEAERA